MRRLISRLRLKRPPIALAALLLAPLLAAFIAAEEPLSRPVRFLLLDGDRKVDPGTRDALSALFRESPLVETLRETLSPESLERAQAIFARSPKTSGGGPLAEAALLSAVRKGKGLVVSLSPATLAAHSVEKEVSILLGIARPTPDSRLERGRDRDSHRSAETVHELVVRVGDQSHEVTQCVTHFRQRGALPQIALEPRARILARAAVLAPEEGPHSTPVLWVVPFGSGRVVVSLLDPESGPAAPLVRALLLRALRYSARAPILTHLPDSLPVAAAELGPEEIGAAPGWPAERGFYRGREIAPVMSWLGAAWLLRPEREENERPEELLDWLEIAPGATVADLGAGNGYFSLRLAERVGEDGRVLAVDVQEKMLDLLRERSKAHGVRNVEPVLATETDPRLPEAAVDLVLAVDVYHELSHPAAVIGKIRGALRDGGRLVLVEYRGEDPSVAIRPLHRMTVAQATAELRPLGLRLARRGDFLPEQHVLVFEKASAAPPETESGTKDGEEAREEAKDRGEAASEPDSESPTEPRGE